MEYVLTTDHLCKNYGHFKALNQCSMHVQMCIRDRFIDDGNADKANEILDYQTVENAIESLLPGKEWGDYLKGHFKPFLNVRLKTCLLYTSRCV